MKHRLIIFLSIALIAGCSTNAQYTSTALHATNRNYAGRFRGQYRVYFDRDQRVIGEGYTTWYLQQPQTGPRTPLRRIPPTLIHRGMTPGGVASILGEPDQQNRQVWLYEVR